MIDAIETMIVAANAISPGTTPDLSRDDLLIYAGSAQWGDWENHVPRAVCMSWPQLDVKARLAVFLTAKLVTTYTGIQKSEISSESP
ncbi:MAG: hypothetical protein ACREA9_17535 [Pyrinomonadaceae bacterium]